MDLHGRTIVADTDPSVHKCKCSQEGVEIREFLRNARLFIILFVRNFLEGLFAILGECSQFCLRSPFIEIQEEIPHFADWEGVGSRGTKIVNKNIVNKLAFPNFCGAITPLPFRGHEEHSKGGLCVCAC